MLGQDLLKGFVGKPPYLERDLRALTPEQILAEAKSISLAPEIKILDKKNLKDLKKFREVVISDDDISRAFIKKYLKGVKIIKDTAFLRWNNMNVITKIPPTSHEAISTKEFDRRFIRLAQKEAGKSSDWWRHVGAALVKGKKMILVGYNKHFPTEHSHYIDGDARSGFNAGPAIAEIVTSQHGEAWVISEIAKRGLSTKGTVLYITTFPCPSCAMLIANSGIKKIYYRDGYSLLDAAKILKNSGVELIRVI